MSNSPDDEDEDDTGRGDSEPADGDCCDGEDDGVAIGDGTVGETVAVGDGDGTAVAVGDGIGGVFLSAVGSTRLPSRMTRAVPVLPRSKCNSSPV